MDVKYVNPFIEAFNTVMPELGFTETGVAGLSAKAKEVVASGVLVVLGLVGDVKGNAVYTIETDAARKIASTMMMGMPVEELDDMAKSAISELTNMLTANAATLFANSGIAIEISTPTLLHGENITIKMNSDQILSAQLMADDNLVTINIAFES